jgi:hypothetical protein
MIKVSKKIISLLKRVVFRLGLSYEYLLHNVDAVLVLLSLEEPVNVEEEGAQMVLSVSIRHDNCHLTHSNIK